MRIHIRFVLIVATRQADEVFLDQDLQYSAFVQQLLTLNGHLLG